MTTSTAQKPTEITVGRNRYGYTIDGEFLRRVTTLCNGIPKPWLGGWAAKTVATFAVENKESWENLGKTDAIKLLKGSPWSKRDDAGDRGTAVHAAIEAIAKGEPIPDDVLTTEDELDCATAAEEFLRATDPKILGVEVTVFSPDNGGRVPGYAGTFDLYCEWEGEKWLWDWKTSKSLYTDHAVQLAAYYNAQWAAANKAPTGKADEEKWSAQLTEWGPDRVDRMGLVHVTPTGAALYPIRYTDRLWDVFRAAALVKLWQLDTDDSFGKTPRERVLDEPLMEVNTDEEAA